MKILHVLDHSVPIHSGYAFRTRAIIEHQRALGWETAQLTSAKHAAKADLEEVVDGLPFYRTPSLSGLAGRLPVLNQLAIVHGLGRRLEAVIERERPDILHAHSPCLDGMAALQVGRRRGLPVVYECRAFWEDAAVDHGTSREWGPRYQMTRALETRVFARADAIVTICDGLAGEIATRGVAPQKITVVPNGVDLTRFAAGGAPDPVLERALGLEGKVVVGFIGSFYAYEGLPLLLEAAAQMAREAPQVRVLLVGGGPQEPELRQRAAALGLESVVRFVGRVPHDLVQGYYDLVDVFAYPRLSMRLTELVTPLKPLEAMAQGRLVVASDVGGHRELIRDDETGRLFESGSATALARTVLALIADPSAGERIRRAARRFVEHERAWPVSVARYRTVYETMLEAKQRAA